MGFFGNWLKHLGNCFCPKVVLLKLCHDKCCSTGIGYSYRRRKISYNNLKHFYRDARVGVVASLSCTPEGHIIPWPTGICVSSGTSVQCAVCGMGCMACGTGCVVYGVQCAVQGVLCGVHSVRAAVCAGHCRHLPGTGACS